MGASSVTTRTCWMATAAHRFASSRPRQARATTATPAPRPTSARLRHLRRRQPGHLHRPRPVPRRRHLRHRHGHLLQSRRSRRHGVATTATPAPRPTVPGCGICVGANPVVCTALDQCHDAGTCNTGTGVCSNPAEARRHGLQRRRRLHPDRSVRRRRHLRRRQPGGLHGARPVPRRRHLRSRHGRLLQSRRSATARRATTATPAPRPTSATARHLRRREPGGLHRARPVPRRRHVQSRHGLCSNPPKSGRHVVQRRRRLHADRPVRRRRHLRGREPGGLHGADQCHDVGTCNPGDRRLLEPAEERTARVVQRRQRLHADRPVRRRRHLRGREPGGVHGADQCHDVGTCNPGSGVCSNPPKSDGTALQRRQRLHADRPVQRQRHLRRRQPGGLHGAEPVSRRRHLRHGGRASARTRRSRTARVATTATPARRPTVQRQRHLRRRQPGGVHGARPVSRRRHLRHGDGRVLEPAEVERHGLQRRRRLHADRSVRGSGTCVGGNPVVCTALSQCHDIGTCDTGTGVCSNPPKSSGTGCSDSDACTQTDQCNGSGTCVGANPVACTALSPCHEVGTCDTGTGICSDPPSPGTKPCNDANACTQTDLCDGAGSCAGGNPVVCSPLDDCHVAGTCDTQTGVCDDPLAGDGTSCSDGNACTLGDTCTGGACFGTPNDVRQRRHQGGSAARPVTTATSSTATGARQLPHHRLRQRRRDRRRAVRRRQRRRRRRLLTE